MTEETHNVWDIALSPPTRGEVFPYLPGQFMFLTLLRGRGLPTEEHPFTISSSPSSEGFVSVTVKESGDFTSTLGETAEGDGAVISAPFGRFSYLLHPIPERLVFIAGGIGMTPLMSMLRYMRTSDPDRSVLLLYANRTQEDIAFREELETIASSEAGPDLRTVHILSNPDPEWDGETGYLDRDKLELLLDGTEDSAFYVCGPPPMMTSVIASLEGMGIETGSIHTEKFSL